MDTKMLEAALLLLLSGEVTNLDEALVEAAADGSRRSGRPGSGYEELEPDVYLSAARSFQDAGVLSSNAGLVLRFANGAEFQLTLVRSR